MSFGIDEPLALAAAGLWNPVEDYWGEPGEPCHPLERTISGAGARPCFEMEQVLPGVDPDDWDSDPIVDAAELHRAGEDRAARHILEGLLTLDRRCVDAWGHLGLIAFDTKGPGAAMTFYETGVAVAEASLPEGFAGVLPWGMVDNRPFLRCLHGLALCAWRQRRWDDAVAMFTARVWIDPSGTISPRLAAVEHSRTIEMQETANPFRRAPRATAYDAIAYLASACDGARRLDHHGFNTEHVQLGHRLATASRWSRRDHRTARQLIRFYRRQLTSGIRRRGATWPWRAPT